MSLSICLSIYLSIYLSICLSASLKTKASARDFLNLWTWQDQKRFNSVRLPQLLSSTTSKTKLFCENSSIFQVDNIKNEAILRDLLQQWKVECRADGLVPVVFFCDFSSPCLQAIAPGTKKWGQVIRSTAPVTQNHLSKPKDLMLQNATLLRKSPPWPPNISAEHVSCIAPVARNACLQILFKCPTPANVFETATKPSHFAHF